MVAASATMLFNLALHLAKENFSVTVLADNCPCIKTRN
jgi:hypothetical protein